MEQKDDFIHLLLQEKSQQEQRLRDLDKSLLQLAFAILAALSLCAPALLSNIQVSESNQIGAYTIVTQIIYLGLFFCVMIVRSRNKSLTLIAVLSRKINLVRQENGCCPVLFNYSFDISDFTRNDKPFWFAVYSIIMLITLSLYVFLVYIILRYVNNLYSDYFIYALILIALEAISLIGYVAIWRLSQVDKNIGKIEKEWNKFSQKAGTPVS